VSRVYHLTQHIIGHSVMSFSRQLTVLVQQEVTEIR